MPETEVGSERHRFCPSCGTEAVGAGSFCSECGGSLIKTGAQPADAATASHQAEATAVPQAFPPPPGVRGLGLTSTLGSYGPPRPTSHQQLLHLLVPDAVNLGKALTPVDVAVKFGVVRSGFRFHHLVDG